MNRSGVARVETRAQLMYNCWDDRRRESRWVETRRDCVVRWRQVSRKAYRLAELSHSVWTDLRDDWSLPLAGGGR